MKIINQRLRSIVITKIMRCQSNERTGVCIQLVSIIPKILESDVLSAKGIRLVPKGVEITSSLLGRLSTIASGVGVAEPIQVSVLVRE